MPKGDKRKKELDTLCDWDFCDVCINFRIRAKIPMPQLRSKESYTPYYRLEHPNWKPSQPRLKQ